jgi:hypothetical protein
MAFIAAGRRPAAMRGSWFGTNRANRRRTHPAHGASARGRRLTRPASACMPSRRTAGARFAMGRRTANGVHRCRPQAGSDARVVALHESRESPSNASNAWSVGPRPTPDEAGERMHAQPSNGRGSLRAGAQDGQWRSSLPAAGRHSMRGSWLGTNRANRRRTHPTHGASARGRRLTRPANACMPSRRTAGARFAMGRRTAMASIAAGRRPAAMRGSWLCTNRANRRRTHPTHGASARGRRLTRPDRDS